VPTGLIQAASNPNPPSPVVGGVPTHWPRSGKQLLPLLERHLFPDQRWWVFWQQLLAGGDRNGAARLFTERSGVGRRPLVEALYVAVRVASFELVLAFLEQAQRHQTLPLSALQQRFRVPPRCPSLPDPVIPQHLLATYDHLVPLAALSGGGSGTAAAAETTQAGALSQPLAAAGRAG